MRRAALMAILALVSTACANKPDYLDMQPKEHVFKGVGDELWWKAVPTKHKGKAFPKMQPEVSWATSDAKVATVDAEGKVRSVGPGQATITATLREMKEIGRAHV